MKSPFTPRSARGGPRAGFSLVELMIAVVILVIAVAGLSSSILSSMVLNRVNRDTTLAQQAVRRMLEELQGEEFAETFSCYNASAGDYGGAGVERGPGFAVPGLDLQVGDPDGLAGRIVFPTVNVGGIDELREDVVDTELGMPMDLDGDTFVDNVNHINDYELLPVRVIVEWRGVNGPRQLAIDSTLSPR